MSGPDGVGAAQEMRGGLPPTAETQVPPQPPRAAYQADARYMYYRQYPGSGSPLPPYPPPPYSAAPPYPQPYPAYPAAMAYPPPYSAPYGYLTYPAPADKYPPPASERAYYAENPTGGGGGGQQDGRLQQEQGLVCTCHHHPVGVAHPGGGPSYPGGGPSYHPAEDDDGLSPPGLSSPAGPAGHAACSCDPPAGPPPLRRSASNFSEDSLVDGVPPAAAPAPAPAPVTPPPPPPVVLRQGGGVVRQPEKRRSLTQEYLAAQAAAEAGRSGPRSLEGAEPVRVPPPEPEILNGAGSERRPSVGGGQRMEPERGASPASGQQQLQQQQQQREVEQREEERPAAAAAAVDSRRLSQAYEDRPAATALDTRRLSQAYDERPTVSTDPRRLSQAYDERPAGAAPDARRLSQTAYDERPCLSASDPHRPSQVYDDKPAPPAPDSRRLSQAAYDERPCVSTQAAPAPATWRLSQAYDDRPAGAAADTRRLSQAHEEKPSAPATDVRRPSQAQAEAAPDSRRLSQACADKPVGPAPDARRLSQAYDDRPAGPAPDARRLSQAYDDRSVGPAPDARRLSQVYDDRPVGPVPVATRRFSLSHMYDERPAVGVAGPDPGRRLSHTAYDDRPAQSRRLSQPLLPTQQLSVAAAVRGSSEPRQSSSTAAAATDGDGRPPCQKYDDRPCTASTDALPTVAAVQPWWDKEPDRATPQHNAITRSKDSPSRRTSVDRSGRAMQLPTAAAAPSSAERKTSPPASSEQRAAAGDAADPADSPLAFTVDFGPADKRLHVKDSISRWAPRTTRRPAAAHGKDDRDETRSDSGDLKATGSGLPRPRSLLRRRQGAPGYHSEGYFSSDQDVDCREGGRRAAAVPRQSALARTPSPRGGSSAARLAARRATVTRVPAAGGLKKSATMGAMPAARREEPSSGGGGGPGGRQGDAPDDVSEAGTYTIENEPDGEEAARQVEAAFSGLEDYGEEKRSDGDSSGKEGSPDRDTETSSKPSAYSSGGSNWIEQWAAEVTKHNQENLKKAQTAPSPGATTKPPTGSSSPWSRQTMSPDGAGRPRRKLPTPPSLSRSPVTGSAGDKSSPGGAAGASLETESYLRTTEDVMSALQARIDAAHTADDSDSDCSDSEGSDDPADPPPPAGKPAPPPTAAGTEFKFNRALSLRRARLGLDTESATSGSSKRPTPPPAPRPSSGGGRKHSDSESGGGPGAAGSGGKAGFARSDGGRYSLRMANGNTKTPPSRPMAVRKTPGSAGGAARSLGSGPRAAAQAAQASREQEMANWKRRKNYDPLRAAKEAKSKKPEPRCGSQSDSACTTAAPLRSASFHGTDGFGSAILRRSGFAAAAAAAAGSEDEAAGRRRSPLVTARATAAAPHRLGYPDDSDVSEVFHDGASAASSTRKVSLDGSRRSHGGSPLYRGPAPASLKNKVKLEALDNLVISTIHTLSSKIRGNSESLVSKLKCQFDEEDVRHTLLDDVMTTLTTDTPSASKASSRDLAGILKNLRKVEQAVQVLEQVLCDDDCDISDDGDDLDAADKFGDGFY